MAVFSPSWTAPEHKAFSGFRKIYPVSRNVLRDVANQYHHWSSTALRSGATESSVIPKVGATTSSSPTLERATDHVVVIIKAREPAGLMTAIGEGKKWHLETKYRWVNQYNFYIQDAQWGPMFVRVCLTFLSPPGSV